MCSFSGKFKPCTWRRCCADLAPSVPTRKRAVDFPWERRMTPCTCQPPFPPAEITIIVLTGVCSVEKCEQKLKQNKLTLIVHFTSRMRFLLRRRPPVPEPLKGLSLLDPLRDSRPFPRPSMCEIQKLLKLYYAIPRPCCLGSGCSGSASDS